MNEEAILEWVLGLHGSAHAVIESVDRKTLQTLIHEVDHLAVFFCKYSLSGHYNKKHTFCCLDGPDCKMCSRILEELETIDDDTDKHNIQFVKSTDAKLASEYGIFDFPALVFFDTGVPIMYGGKSRVSTGSAMHRSFYSSRFIMIQFQASCINIYIFPPSPEYYSHL